MFSKVTVKIHVAFLFVMSIGLNEFTFTFILPMFCINLSYRQVSLDENI